MPTPTPPVIFILSVQHTGTGFVASALQRLFPAAAIFDISYLTRGSTVLDSPTIVRSHFPIIRSITVDPEMDFNSVQQLGINYKSIGYRAALAFAAIFPVVIPLRDPLAAILTRESRHPEFRHFFIVDGFVEIARRFAHHPNVIFFPVDAPKTYEERRDLIRRVAAHCGIDVSRSGLTIGRIARRWRKVNSTPGNPFSDHYAVGDISSIRDMLGPKWAEVRYLKNRADFILPLLASAGYTREDTALW